MLVLAGVIGVYVSDQLLTHLLFSALEHQAGWGFLLRAVLYAIPDMMFVALPIALLVAVYLVLLRRREARELAVLAGAGSDPRALLLLPLGIGSAGMLISLLLSGFVEPHAMYRFQQNIHDLRHATIIAGRLPPGNTYEIGEMTLHTLPGASPGDPPRLFIGHRLENGTTRIMTARAADVLSASAGRSLWLRLTEARILDFRPGDGAQFPRSSEPVVRVDVELMDYMPTGAVLPPYRPRTAHYSTMTLFELLVDARTNTSHAGEATARIWGALMCLLAPLLGFLAMALTTARSIYVALPAACLAALAGAFFGGHAVAVLAGYGLMASLGATLVLAAALVCGLCIWIARLENSCIRPEGVSI